MFNPLMSDMSALKDIDVDNKITELHKKYLIAAKSGNGGLCSQIIVAINTFREEQQRRLLEKSKISLKNQDKDMGDLINID